MSTADTTTEASANTGPSSADALRDSAPIPRPVLGPALNKQGTTPVVSSGTSTGSRTAPTRGVPDHFRRDARDGHTQRRQP